MSTRAIRLALTLTVVLAGPVAAQPGGGTREVALDTVVGVQDYFDDSGAWKTQLIIDPFGTVEVAPRLQVSVRPLVWRVMMGNWESYVAQASVRYQFEKGNQWRVEAGKFTSPIGLGMTENRANVNDDIIWWHRGYYSYLPPIGGGAAPHDLEVLIEGEPARAASATCQGTRVRGYSRRGSGSTCAPSTKSKR